MSTRWRWEVFLSHNGLDRGWVRETVAEWRAGGLRVFYDQDSIQPGEDVVAAIERAVDQSRHVVLIVSSAAVESRWIALEASLALFSDPDAMDRRVIPVFLDAVDESRIRPAIRRLNRIDLSNARTARSEYQRLLAALGLSGSMAERPRPSAEERRAFHFPVLAVMGAKGGSGKTTIVVAMAELIASTGRNVLIIDADLEAAGVTRYLSSNAPVRPAVWSVLDAAFAHQGGDPASAGRDTGAWDVTPRYLRDSRFGKIHLIPSKHASDSRIPYNAIADIHPDSRRNEVALAILRELIDRHTQAGRRIDAVLIDSGAEMNPLVSAGVIAADYGYIVCGPHGGFVSTIAEYERMHRARYPGAPRRAMHVIVNQATDETIRTWSSQADVHFVREDPEYRRHAAAGQVDFEGVGLNNLYLDVLGVLRATLAAAHQSWLPEPVDVWVKPYLRRFGDFPETMLRQRKYRLLYPRLIAVAIVACSVVAASLWFIVAALRGPWPPAVVEVRAPENVSRSMLKQDLSRLEVPPRLRGKVELLGTSVIVREPLEGPEQAEFGARVDSEEAVAAFREACRTLEEWQSVRVAGAAFAALAGLILLGFTIARAVPLAKQRAALRHLIRLRDSGDERRLANWITTILDTRRDDNELRWLRDQYRRWTGEGRGFPY